jgi:L-iditol 2-dehydrogenase
MLAAVYHGPEDLRVEERPVPAMGPAEALLKVHSASICATDLRIYAGGHRKYGPGVIRIPGHEITGVLVEVGRDVRGIQTGQMVFIAPNIGCGHCRQCAAGRNNLCPDYDAFGITLDGGFSEYMRVTAGAIEQGNVIPLDPAADPAAMALAEPLACVLHGQDALDVRPGDVVLIQGAGPIGIMHLLMAKARGATRVILSDRLPERLAKGAELGADRTVDIDAEDLSRVVGEATGGAGADVVIVAAPVRAAMEESLQLAAYRGRINFFAGLPKQEPCIQADANLIHYKELVVTGSTGSSTGDCRRAVELAAAGKVDLHALIGDRFPLTEAPAAFAAARHHNGWKVILQPELRRTFR